MSWQTSLVTMVRYLINDIDSSTYDNATIENSIIVSALITTQEYSFPTSYTIELDAASISPDPTSTSDYDGIAIALWTLKAACMLLTNQYKDAISSAAKVSDGDDGSIDTSVSFKGYQDILNLGPCGAYKTLLKTLVNRRSMSLGRAIMTPFTHMDLTSSRDNGVGAFFNSLIR